MAELDTRLMDEEAVLFLFRFLAPFALLVCVPNVPSDDVYRGLQQVLMSLFALR